MTVMNSEPMLKLDLTVSLFDDICKDCPAQYANDDGTPTKAWDNVTTVLSDIDTSKTHYVRVPENHIVIDFDIPDENGEKSMLHTQSLAKAAAEFISIIFILEIRRN